jgi:hypothetical protein
VCSESGAVVGPLGALKSRPVEADSDLDLDD